jgi:hypothetical protein
MSDEKRIPVQRDDLRTLFDLVVHSLDFGSGFLDGNDVPALRRVAELIGVDPMIATPENEAWKYPHKFKEFRYFEDETVRCGLCKRAKDFGKHIEGESN